MVGQLRTGEIPPSMLQHLIELQEIKYMDMTLVEGMDPIAIPLVAFQDVDFEAALRMAVNYVGSLGSRADEHAARLAVIIQGGAKTGEATRGAEIVKYLRRQVNSRYRASRGQLLKVWRENLETQYVGHGRSAACRGCHHEELKALVDKKAKALAQMDRSLKALDKVEAKVGEQVVDKVVNDISLDSSLNAWGQEIRGLPS